ARHCASSPILILAGVEWFWRAGRQGFGGVPGPGGLVMRLDEFRWTTRREVCEQLLRFVVEAETTALPEHDGPYAEPDPSRAETLLWSLADESCTDVLQRLPKGEEGSLEAKLRELRLKAEISAQDLAEVL